MAQVLANRLCLAVDPAKRPKRTYPAEASLLSQPTSVGEVSIERCQSAGWLSQPIQLELAERDQNGVTLGTLWIALPQALVSRYGTLPLTLFHQIACTRQELGS